MPLNYIRVDGVVLKALGIFFFFEAQAVLFTTYFVPFECFIYSLMYVCHFSSCFDFVKETKIWFVCLVQWRAILEAERSYCGHMTTENQGRQ